MLFRSLKLGKNKRKRQDADGKVYPDDEEEDGEVVDEVVEEVEAFGPDRKSVV